MPGCTPPARSIGLLPPSPPARPGTDRWPELRRRLNAALPATWPCARSAPRPRDSTRGATPWKGVPLPDPAGGRRRPLDRHRTLEIGERLDVACHAGRGGALPGERDFAALGSDAQGRTVRHLSEVTILRRGDLVEVRVTANAFLRRMVRSIVAILLEVGRGRLAPEAVDELLGAGERALHGRAAPARGLTLERVIYESKINGR